MPFVYTFEAKSIQSYILDSSRLRDMVGASEQIENLCADDGLLDKVLDALKAQDRNFKEPDFSRRAGGVFTAFFDNMPDAQNFQAVWTFCVQQALPGLEFVQGMAEVTDGDCQAAVKAANETKDTDRNRLYARLPLPGPFAARYPRTGGASVCFHAFEKSSEALDESTVMKRFFGGKSLEDKINAFTSDYDKPEWPTFFPGVDRSEHGNGIKNSQFPLLADNRYIGVIHADANRLGQIIQQFSNALNKKDYRSVMKRFSDAIQKATLEAIHSAIRDELVKFAEQQYHIMPARPLVVGGDDISFIVRGDLALAFTVQFLTEFEKTTETALELFREYDPTPTLPKHLTACAGVAFVKAGQPFYQAYRLAEDLCNGTAKRISKQYKTDAGLVPSSLAFHRITTSMIDSYPLIRERELTTANGIALTMQPYFAGKFAADLTPRYEDLKSLADALQQERISHGALRELFGLLCCMQKSSD